MIALVFIGILLLGILLSVLQSQSDRADIIRWTREYGYTIVQIEKTWFDNGPFWFRGRGRRIYRCRLRDGNGRSHTMYMRSRFLANDYEFYDP